MERMGSNIGELNTKFEVPLFDLSYANSLIREHIMDVMEWHIEISAFILGSDVRLFEDKFPRLVGCKYAVGVNSGSDYSRTSLWFSC